MKMRPVLLASALFSFVSSLFVRGMKTVSQDAESQAARNAKLDRVNNHRRGRGKRSFVKIHERIVDMELAHAKRRQRGRWAPPGLPLHDEGYHTPKDAVRAVRRAERWANHQANGQNPPSRMMENADQAMRQLSDGVQRRA